MMTSFIASESLLAVDVGTTKTRAQFFDVIDGRYRFVASKSVETTIGHPYWNVEEGVRRAVNGLAEITGRIFFRSDGTLITPSAVDNSGVDSLVITMSAGEPLRTVAVGLIDEVSVESAHHLAATTYSTIVDTISLNDRRSQESRIDAIIQARPDLIIMAGGINGGASHSIRKLLTAVGLACYLLPKGYRPHVLYAGNQQLADEVRDSLTGISELKVSKNIRPTLKIEQLAPAQPELLDIYRNIRYKQSKSIKELEGWSNTRLIPTAFGFERIIRFLSKVYDPEKGVLGVDIGASAMTIATAFNGKSALGVYPQLGVAHDVSAILGCATLGEISRWLPYEVPEDDLLDYIHNKAIYPDSLPTTKEELSIDHAIGRQIMRIAVRKISKRFKDSGRVQENPLLPWIEPIIASGGLLTNAASLGQTLLMLLDGLQPTGVTTVLLDINNLVSTLGAAADINPALVIQVLGSNSMMNLGPVIAPIGVAKQGTNILNIQISYEDGQKVSREIKFGSIEVLPLAEREKATIRVQPLQRFDVGMGPGLGGSLQVVGGVMGVIIDGRGRPLVYSSDPAQRRAWMGKSLRKLEKQ